MSKNYLEDMNTFQQVFYGLMIVQEYEPSLCAEHDQIYLEVNGNITVDNVELLKKLDWVMEDEDDFTYWYHYV